MLEQIGRAMIIERTIVINIFTCPYNTHYRFLDTINDSLPIDIVLEKQCNLALFSIKCSSMISTRVMC